MLSFVWVLGIQTQALMLAQQMVFPLSHLPISLIIFYLFVLCFEMEGEGVLLCSPGQPESYYVALMTLNSLSCRPNLLNKIKVTAAPFIPWGYIWIQTVSWKEQDRS